MMNVNPQAVEIGLRICGTPSISRGTPGCWSKFGISMSGGMRMASCTSFFLSMPPAERIILFLGSRKFGKSDRKEIWL